MPQSDGFSVDQLQVTHLIQFFRFITGFFLQFWS